MKGRPICRRGQPARFSHDPGTPCNNHPVPLRHEFEGVKAVFFDLDDTLCAYWDAAKTGLRRAFEDHPEHGSTPDDLLREWAVAFSSFVETIGKTHWYEKYRSSGETTRVELMRRMLERTGVFDEELASRLSHTYHVERQAALALFPEAQEVLEALHAGYPLGLITNGPSDIQHQEIQKLNIGPLFTHLLVEGDLGFGKPDPRVFQAAEEMSRCAGPEILFVGNSYKHDIVPSFDFGWRTAWVRRESDVAPSSRTGKPEELPEGAREPDLTIGDLRELLG